MESKCLSLVLHKSSTYVVSNVSSLHEIGAPVTARCTISAVVEAHAHPRCAFNKFQYTQKMVYQKMVTSNNRCSVSGASGASMQRRPPLTVALNTAETARPDGCANKFDLMKRCPGIGVPAFTLCNYILFDI